MSRWPERTVDERFFSRVHMTDGCWIWTGHDRRGYGRFSVNGRTVQAHRFAYEQVVGPVPEGLTLDHLCRNTLCVRPDHLEPCTAGENMLRGDTIQGINSRKTHCLRGHLLDDENTYVTPSGYRNCRECQRERSRAWKRRNVA